MNLPRLRLLAHRGCQVRRFIGPSRPSGRHASQNTQPVSTQQKSAPGKHLMAAANHTLSSASPDHSGRSAPTRSVRDGLTGRAREREKTKRDRGGGGSSHSPSASAIFQPYHPIIRTRTHVGCPRVPEAKHNLQTILTREVLVREESSGFNLRSPGDPKSSRCERDLLEGCGVAFVAHTAVTTCCARTALG